VRFRWWHFVLLGIAAVAVFLLVGLALLIPFSSDELRGHVVAALADQLDANVTLAEFHARIFPTLHVEGSDLVIRQKRRPDAPLFTIRTFAADAGLLPLLRHHVTTLKLTGLEIQIPPGDDAGDDNDRDDEHTGAAVATSGGERSHDDRKATDVVIDHLVSNGARLVIISRHPEKAPKIWAIHDLRMRDVGLTSAMPFTATLTNAVPPGEIRTAGSFGPWAAHDPAATPLDGTFTFENADLGTFKGIGGILNARGTFTGSLGRIDVTGETDTPRFTVTIANHPVPLHTRYHSIVDGTNGDTLLERIDARLLNTSLVARGVVVDTPHADDTAAQKGRTVTVDVAIADGRLEDLLRLAVPTSQPPMSGTLQMTTKLTLPPGNQDVVDKLRLDGRFDIDDARFASDDVQRKIDELSRRSRGKPEDAATGAASDFSGRFRLAGAVLHLPDLAFAVRGARVRLAGNYGLRTERLDFSGTLLMDAAVSETKQGAARILLKLVDPLFKRDGGGSAIPITVTGTRGDPSFGLDKGRIFHR